LIYFVYIPGIQNTLVQYKLLYSREFVTVFVYSTVLYCTVLPDTVHRIPDTGNKGRAIYVQQIQAAIAKLNGQLFFKFARNMQVKAEPGVI
jgi:hypothetical protein